VRKIYLPELLSLSISNYSLYPNGLDYTFDFVKGFNLILGGNGMGKTTFVTLIKFALLGNYKKQYEYTRTYKESKIEKRERNSDDFFRNRIDSRIQTDPSPSVTINFKINDTTFTVSRDLVEIKILGVYVDGALLEGEAISESRYENLKKSNKNSDDDIVLDNLLPSLYEKEIEKKSGISFDDLIFFVNYILFFGEDHRTVLWDVDVQKELFNTFFNSPELNLERQEAEREAKYFNSISRHKSEDKRAIRKVLDKVEQKNEGNVPTPTIGLIKLKEKIESLSLEVTLVHDFRKQNLNKISVLESRKNAASQALDGIETKRNQLINNLSFSEYKHQHKQYPIFLKNIQSNHICPLCNSPSEALYIKATEHNDHCWVCDSQLINSNEMDLEKKTILENLNKEYSELSNSLKNIQREINDIENQTSTLDTRFKNLDSEKRQALNQVRELEYENSKDENPKELQPFYEELEKLNEEQEYFANKSIERKAEANRIAKLIEDTVLQNVQNFSNQFTLFAEKFLGVPALLTYEKFEGDELKKFYPIINGTVRKSDLELSESQRFFIDHAFRMSILSHFYTTPTFYIVETPDSSLDLSYEKNAADVFSSFLEKPYSLILTSNLNNSSFVDYIIHNESREHAIVPLFEIAKKSVIQESNITLHNLYNSIKNG
jgi:DNA repair exonuclease SbcCD ATPase subunit